MEAARKNYEDACRWNRWGNNEQRDLQRFLKKHDLKKRPGPLKPPEGCENLRNFGLRVRPHEEADLLRRMADQFQRQGRLLDARKALQDLYLFDPCDAEVFQRDKAIERSAMGQAQMNARYQREQLEYQKQCGIFGKFARFVPETPPNLGGPLNIVNLNHIRLGL